MGFIYRIVCNISNKCYIGQTRRTIAARWWQHKYHAAKSDLNCHSKLYRAMQKYGCDAFTVEEIEECSNNQLNEREVYWINYYDSVDSGYNIAPGGSNRNPKARKIAQFDLEGNYLNTFESAQEAALTLKTIPQKIYSVCYQSRKSYLGFQWRFLEDAEKVGMRLERLKVQPKARAVHQYTMDGKYMTSYSSASEAMAQFGAKHGTGGIRAVCIGRNRHSHGYRWSYEKVDHLDEIRKDEGLRKVVQLDDNSHVIAVYEKVRDAGKAVGRSECSIWSVCNGVHEKSAGYRWQYYDDYIKERKDYEKVS